MWVLLPWFKVDLRLNLLELTWSTTLANSATAISQKYTYQSTNANPTSRWPLKLSTWIDSGNRILNIWLNHKLRYYWPCDTRIYCFVRMRSGMTNIAIFLLSSVKEVVYRGKSRDLPRRLVRSSVRGMLTIWSRGNDASDWNRDRCCIL